MANAHLNRVAQTHNNLMRPMFVGLVIASFTLKAMSPGTMATSPRHDWAWRVLLDTLMLRRFALPGRAETG